MEPSGIFDSLMKSNLVNYVRVPSLAPDLMDGGFPSRSRRVAYLDLEHAAA